MMQTLQQSEGRLPDSGLILAGPTPRRAADRSTGVPGWMTAVLDALDYGVLVLNVHHCVQHVNRAARAMLRFDALGLRWQEAFVDGSPAELLDIGQAIDAACDRGWRRLVTLDREGGPLGVAVVPLAERDAADSGAGGLGASGAARTGLMLVLSRARVCEPLTMHWFARSHGLTAAEARVLEELCSGATPAEVARTLGVALSTVRTQVANIRAKTGAPGIRQLVGRVACLPPVVCAVDWR